LDIDLRGWSDDNRWEESALKSGECSWIRNVGSVYPRSLELEADAGAKVGEPLVAGG